MGEEKNSYFRVSFNQKLKVGFKGAEVTSDGGLLAIREMDEQLGLTKIAGEYLQDNRYGKNVQHEMTGLLRQSVYSRLGGYEDTNDAEGLKKDPGMRAIIGERAWLDKLVSHGYIDTFRKLCDKPLNYTWWDYKTGARERNIGWRLDYFFISESLLKYLNNSYILKDVPGSDHCPVAIELNNITL